MSSFQPSSEEIMSPSTCFLPGAGFLNTSLVVIRAMHVFRHHTCPFASVALMYQIILFQNEMSPFPLSSIPLHSIPSSQTQTQWAHFSLPSCPQNDSHFTLERSSWHEWSPYCWMVTANDWSSRTRRSVLLALQATIPARNNASEKPSVAERPLVKLSTEDDCPSHQLLTIDAQCLALGKRVGISEKVHRQCRISTKSAGISIGCLTKWCLCWHTCLGFKLKQNTTKNKTG